MRLHQQFKDLQKFLVDHLPRWLQMTKLTPAYDILAIPCSAFAVVLLESHCGVCNHVVAIYKGKIFDANESECMKLCDEALDYFVHDETHVKFKAICKGLMFVEQGTKQQLEKIKFK